MEEKIKYDFEVLEVRADDGPGRNGVIVRYTPEWEECSVVEIFVGVPFEKALSQNHAFEIMEKKIRSRVPAMQWRNELGEDQSGDTKTIGDELASKLGVSNESSTVGRGRSKECDRVFESSGSQGIRSGSDGDDQNEISSDSEAGG